MTVEINLVIKQLSSSDNNYMNKHSRLMLLLFMSVYILLVTGCADEIYKPKADLVIVSVDPYNLHATATDSASLPVTTVNIQSFSGLPAQLYSYTARYYTLLGDEIVGLALNSISIQTRIEPMTQTAIELKPYTSRVVKLFDTTSSDIAPLVAKMRLFFKDVNDNKFELEASCLLYEPFIAEDSAEEAEIKPG